MRITWWGHATVLIELGGIRLLTDPALTRRLAHLTRQAPRPPGLSADAVLVSHLHADHLHVPSLRRVRAPRALVPAGGAALARRGGVSQVQELDVGDRAEVDGVAVTAVPAAHDGRRLPGSRTRGPALGYVLAHGGVRVWFAGDTGLFDGLDTVGPVDVAVVPVGGWGPTLGPEHLDPAQAVEAALRVGARDAVPVHYGTYWPVGLRPLAPGIHRRMFDEPGQRFAEAAAQRGLRAHVLDCGGSVELGDG